MRLISYIALGAPATRRPASGDESFIRPELGFTPRWYRETLDIDFRERWHTDPDYREKALGLMAAETRRRFPGVSIGRVGAGGEPEDLLTGAYGGAFIAALYGQEIRYSCDNWPSNEHRYISEIQAARLEPPELDRHPLFIQLMEQAERIARLRGRIDGYINWQGVLNSAMRIRGEEIFMDMTLRPEMARHIFSCVAHTMTDGARRLYERQRRSGVDIRHFTVSNCVVNMISPAQYREFLLPFDLEFAREFGTLGVHNCAWNATPWLNEYERIPGLGYIDMGLDSDLEKARALFPYARRALMYTPMDVANKSLDEIRADIDRLAREYAPCDLVLADIEAATPDGKIIEIVNLCGELSGQ